jgi:hypothetical protein
MCLKSSIFWDITPHIPSKASRRFGGKRRPHLQARIISQARNQLKEVDGGGVLFQSVRLTFSGLLRDVRTTHKRAETSQLTLLWGQVARPAVRRVCQPLPCILYVTN